MPPFEDELYGRNQDALLWDFAGSFDGDGRPQCHAYTTLVVQWKTSRRLVQTADRGTVQLSAEAVVAQKVSVHSLLWLGTESTWLSESGSGSGLDDPELHEVISYQEQKDLRGRETRRVIGLVRFRKSPPTLV